MLEGFVLLPQLLPGEAEQLAPEIGARSVADLRREAELRDLDSVPVIYSPTGGNKIPLADLRDLAQRIRRKAEAYGYPDTERTERGRRDFDYALAELLHSQLQISVHEASKKAVWEFLTCILVPDVVRWRFWREDSATRQTRFVGGVKNTFRRLWRRAFVLYDPDSHDPYALMRFLLEDQLVQLVERPQLSASRVLARSTVIAYRNSLARNPEVNREDLFRDAQKRLIRVMPIMCFEALNESLLERFLEGIFDDAAAILASSKKTSDTGVAGTGNGKEGRGMLGILRRLKGSGVGAATQ